jgi:hypothetical protein
MSEPERITWDLRDYGLIGRVGAAGWLFRIHMPDEGQPEWILTSELPGQHGKRFYGNGSPALMETAEEWLREFAAHLGAKFKD